MTEKTDKSKKPETEKPEQSQKSDKDYGAPDSKAYDKASRKAEEYINDPEKLDDLLKKARAKAESKKGVLNEVWDTLNACFRLLKAYASGSYRTIAWGSLVMIVASVVYFLMPVDLIPDFILALGYVDDAAVLGWTLKQCASDIDEFQNWERNQSGAEPGSSTA